MRRRARLLQVFLVVCRWNFIPPMMILGEKKMYPMLTESAPSDTIGGCSNSDWIDSDLFMKYIKNFVVHIICSPNSKVC